MVEGMYSLNLLIRDFFPCLLSVRGIMGQASRAHDGWSGRGDWPNGRQEGSYSASGDHRICGATEGSQITDLVVEGSSGSIYHQSESY